MMSDTSSAARQRHRAWFVFLPVLISIASLVFGAYQYLDKRNLEKENLWLERRAMLQQQADMITHYVITDLASLHTFIEHGESFDNAMLSWVGHIETLLPFKAEIRVVENDVHKALRSYREDIQDHEITFLLVRNSGTGRAKDVTFELSVDYGPDAEPRTQEIVIDELGPGGGAILALDHYHKITDEHFGPKASPAYSLRYFDVFLGEDKTTEIRTRYEVATLVAPRVRLEE